MTMIPSVLESSRLLIQICFWFELGLIVLVLFNRLRSHWIGVSLAARFAKECRRRGLVAPAPIQH